MPPMLGKFNRNPSAFDSGQTNSLRGWVRSNEAQAGATAVQLLRTRAGGAAPARIPNVVMVYGDDVGYGDPGVNGYRLR